MFTAAIPKGFGAKHEAEGILRILPEFELGLTDIEGFSHLMVIWAFDRSHRAVQTRSALPSSSYFAVRTDCCALEASTCSMERPSSKLRRIEVAENPVFAGTMTPSSYRRSAGLFPSCRQPRS
jgi:hypothetical protein